MLGNRRLNAPQPPGAQLTETTVVAAPADEKVFNVITLSGRYAIKKQARHKAYRKKREEFFEDRCKDAIQSSVVPHRSPSRYLRSVWKFDPDREHVVDSILHNGQVDHEVEIPLESFIGFMVRVANPQRQRYHYRSAAPLPDGRCAVCNKQLEM